MTDSDTKRASIILDALPHLLALKDRPFTRWSELNGKQQEEYIKEARRLIQYGSEHDIAIRAVADIKRNLEWEAMKQA